MGLFKKIGKEQIKKIPARRFNKVKVKNEKGEMIGLDRAGLKKLIMDIAFGKKSLNMIEKKLISEGIKGTQWEKRKKIIALLEETITPQQAEELALELDEADD